MKFDSSQFGLKEPNARSTHIQPEEEPLLQFSFFPFLGSLPDRFFSLEYQRVLPSLPGYKFGLIFLVFQLFPQQQRRYFHPLQPVIGVFPLINNSLLKILLQMRIFQNIQLCQGTK